MKQVSVIGAGIMGNGIAQVIATAGMNVSLYDINEGTLSQAFTMIEGNLDDMIDHSLINKDEKSAIMKRITGTLNFKKCLENSDMIIEVIPENLVLKKALFKDIESIVSDDVIIASNTSAILLTELTEEVNIPSRFIITHFMNPATLVPLVEVITQDSTDKNVIAHTMDLIKRIGKSPVHLKREIPGAVVNRLQAALLREAFYLVEEGVVSLQDIDQIIKDGAGFRWGFIGPMQMVDLGGLDTWGQILDHLGPELNNSTKRSVVVDELIKEGHLGIKTGKGVYDYDDDSLEKIISKRDEDFMTMLKLREEQEKTMITK